MGKIKVTLIKSPIGFKLDQKRTVEALGLRKINSFRIHEENEAVKGMIFKIKHLIKVEEAKEVKEKAVKPSVVKVEAKAKPKTEVSAAQPKTKAKTAEEKPESRDDHQSSAITEATKVTKPKAAEAKIKTETEKKAVKAEDSEKKSVTKTETKAKPKSAKPKAAETIKTEKAKKPVAKAATSAKPKTETKTTAKSKKADDTVKKDGGKE